MDDDQPGDDDYDALLPAPDPDEGRWHWNVARVAAVAVVLATAGFWIWAFSPLPTRGNPDRLDDRTFPAAAEGVCAAGRDRIDSLPSAREMNDVRERADLIDEGTDVVIARVAELRTIRPDTEDGELIGLWLDDYDTYIADRQTYADLLRSGVDEPFTVTVRGVEGVSTLIDGFAKVNDMVSCQVPPDV
ncbi:MAG: hypothetical protein OEU32_16510 [Acidimicrobiia bacterium]|nr:hypothetical protein [Acidimicrobiia bacterium]